MGDFCCRRYNIYCREYIVIVKCIIYIFNVRIHAIVREYKYMLYSDICTDIYICNHDIRNKIYPFDIFKMAKWLSYAKFLQLN